MDSAFLKSISVFAIIAFAAFFTSCDKESESFTDVENFVLNSINSIEDECGAGREMCFELVFPITIMFSDNSTAEVNNYLELKQAIRSWFHNNGDHSSPSDRPKLVLPVQVINEAGEIISVDTPEALQALRNECNHHHGDHHQGDHHHGEPCFTLNFPLTISFADGTETEVNTKEEFRTAVLIWKEANPDQHVPPMLVFPLQVTLTDGTVVTVGSKEELHQLKEDCRG